MLAAQKQNEKGFTLIEAIVAAAIFATAVVSIVDVYTSTVRLNRKTDGQRKASENARYITEYLSKEIRNGQVDYFGPTVSPCTTNFAYSARTLGLVNTDNVHLCFYMGDDAGLVSSSGTNLWLIKGNAGPYKINSDDVTTTNIIFFTSPQANPYTTQSAIQPRVTITGTVTAKATGATSNFETTVTIPAYDIIAP